MTPEEKVREVLDSLAKEWGTKTFVSDGYGYYNDAFFAFSAAIREASPREVSEDEIEKFALTKFANDTPTSRSLREVWKDGYRQAMRQNAIAKLESIWPSEDEFCRAFDKRFPNASMETTGWGVFYWMKEWLKARVLGGQK